jgi:hypothetical protein
MTGFGRPMNWRRRRDPRRPPLALAVALLARGPVEPEGLNREWNLRF